MLSFLRTEVSYSLKKPATFTSVELGNSVDN